MCPQIGKIYSIFVDNNTLITNRINNKRYLRYGAQFNNCLFLGDIGISFYGQNSVSFLLNNDVISFYYSFLKENNLTEVI
jgi:hypothetical protein